MEPGLRKGRKRVKRGGLDTKPEGLKIPEGASTQARAGPGRGRRAGVTKGWAVDVVWGEPGGPQEWMLLRGSCMLTVIGLKGTGDHCRR